MRCQKTERQQNEIGKTMHKQNEKYEKEIGRIKKNRTTILELKNTMTELKNSTESFDSRLNLQKNESCNLKTGHLKLERGTKRQKE